MHTMTERNLHEAFAGESQAHMKYLIYGERAEHEKKPEAAPGGNEPSGTVTVTVSTSLAPAPCSTPTTTVSRR